MGSSNLDRINELYHKSQSVGLTQEEKEEQDRLRKEYVAAFRKNLRGTLENISFVDPEGPSRKPPISRKRRNKKK